MLAFTFPGQGSQRPGMGRPWTGHPSWEVVGEASDLSGLDLASLLLDADADELRPTAAAQLATFVTSMVILDALERVGLDPASCAGHSLGEYSALVGAGALAFEDAVRLVAARGEAMHEAAEERQGTMVAVLGAEDDAVEAACHRAEGEVWVANYNAPGQVVVAGDPEAVERAGALARELGARKILPMAVAGAFHTPFMSPARAPLRKALAETAFEAPDVPVVANVDGRAHLEAADWPGLLSAQLCSPVRWRASLATLAELGVTTFVELGPGGVLSGLARRTVPGAKALTVADPSDIDKLVALLSGTETWPGTGLAEGDLASAELRASVPGAPASGGERIFFAERVVVSPVTGVFEPAPALGVAGPGGAAGVGTAAGAVLPDPSSGVDVAVGDVVGSVSGTEVRTAFGGVVMGYLAHRGERVDKGQPLAWLRTPAGA